MRVSKGLKIKRSRIKKSKFENCEMVTGRMVTREMDEGYLYVGRYHGGYTNCT
jgi:hypothetical protein